MTQTLLLTGDMNFQGVTAPDTIFAKVADALRDAGVVFGNLECCFFERQGHDPGEREGFYAPPAAATATAATGAAADTPHFSSSILERSAASMTVNAERSSAS